MLLTVVVVGGKRRRCTGWCGGKGGGMAEGEVACVCVCVCFHEVITLLPCMRMNEAGLNNRFSLSVSLLVIQCNDSYM